MQKGVKRGKYRQSASKETKRRVIAAAHHGEDWRAVALNNDVPVKTAYGWISRGYASPKKRGGYRKRKLSEEDINYVIGLLERNPVITLKEMRAKLMINRNVTVTVTTLHNYLVGKLYTVKKVISEPNKMNEMCNKLKRKAFVEAVQNEEDNGKHIIYIDETNINLFIRRNFGRAPKGTKCIVQCPTSRGKNIHIIGAISKQGLVYSQKRRGSYRKDDCCAWLKAMLLRVTEPLDRVVVVCDNAPVHCALETVFEEDPFSEAKLLRLAPYSAPINPIEECWSVLKAGMKREIAATMSEMLSSSHPGVTQTEHRANYLENVIENNMPLITSSLCNNTHEHVKKHYSKILNLEDLKPDDNQ